MLKLDLRFDFGRTKEDRGRSVGYFGSVRNRNARVVRLRGAQMRICWMKR